jgi:type IV pilus assembly protein PilA
VGSQSQGTEAQSSVSPAASAGTHLGAVRDRRRGSHFFSVLKGLTVIARIQKSIKENEEGFTLIELLVVIIIIGILAAIAIPVFLNQRKKAVDASIKSDLRTVANEMETYYVDNQAYPLAGVVAASTGAAVPNVLTIGSASGISMSAGNQISVVISTGAGAGTAYEVCGYNTKSSANVAGSSFSYISNKGGLQPGNTGCALPGTF